MRRWPRLVLPDVLLDYRCNLRGCCCGDWNIPVRRSDLARIGRARPDLDEATLAEPGTVRGVAPEPGESQALFLRQRPLAGRARCLLLEPTGGCSLHAAHGAEVLPDLCALFPGRLFAVAGRLELRLTTLCPGVLGPLLAGEQAPREAVLGDPQRLALSLRPTDVRVVDEVLVGPQRLSAPEAVRLRRVLLGLLVDPTASATRRLGELLTVLEAVAAGRSLDAPVAALPLDEEAFAGRLLAAAEAWSPERLAGEVEAYRPFFEGPAATHPAAGPRLLDALADWTDGLLRFVEPAEQAWRPALLRFLWVRTFSLFHVDGGPFVADGERLLRLYALVLRFLAALAQARAAPPDRALLGQVLGLASYVDYHVEG